MSSFYDFTLLLSDGRLFDLNELRGKKILIVNTASECGYTPQYAQLQEMHLEFSDQLAILAFPCNQFGGQEPGSDRDIQAFCSLNYGVTFPVMQKCDVKGKDAHPLYQWLTRKALNGVADSEIKWNFQKYAISGNGELVGMYAHSTDPTDPAILDWILQPTLF